MNTINIEQSYEVLEQLTDRPRWFLAFSGGKDSTTLLILTVEFLRRKRPPGVTLDVLYSDTRLEIPMMAMHASRMLEHTRELAIAENLPIRIHRLRSPLDESFWVLVLGKGYPIPSFRFRWCTDRLKVRPMNRLARALCPDPAHAIMLIGVRQGESTTRDHRLRNNCNRGECGPAAIGKASIFPTAAPLLRWRTCEVWDFLAFVAPRWGWPTEGMWRLYGEDERVRYGCWVCPLVRRDRAMEVAIAAADGERPALEAMAAFRLRLLEISRDPENRVVRPDGRLGRLTLETRCRLLLELLTLQRHTKVEMITDEEVQRILHLWKTEEDIG